MSTLTPTRRIWLALAAMATLFSFLPGVAAADPGSGARVSAEVSSAESSVVADSGDAVVRAGLPASPAVSIVVTPATQEISNNVDPEYSVTVTNTGDVSFAEPDGRVTVLGAETNCGRTLSLAVGESTTYTCRGEGGPGGPGTITIDFAASAVNDVLDLAAAAETDVELTVFVPAPGLSFEVTPAVQTIDSGSRPTFQVTVTNTGNIDFAEAGWADVRVRLQTDEFDDTDCDRDLDLVVGASLTYTCLAPFGLTEGRSFSFRAVGINDRWKFDPVSLEREVEVQVRSVAPTTTNPSTTVPSTTVSSTTTASTVVPTTAAPVTTDPGGVQSSDLDNPGPRPEAQPSTTPSAVDNGALARTGSDTQGLIASGIALVLLGSGLLAVRRRGLRNA